MQTETHKTHKTDQPQAFRLKSTIDKLRDKASKDTVFNAVCHVFAIRERTRQQITMNTLKARMTKEGFKNISNQQYEDVLKFLASMGIGRLDHDTKGRIRALKDIKVTLQSLGRVTVQKGENPHLDMFKKTPHYYDLPVPKPEQPQDAVVRAETKEIKAKPEPKEEPKHEKEPQTRGFQVALTVSVGNNPITFQVPQRITAAELGELMLTLFGGNPMKGENNERG